MFSDRRGAFFRSPYQKNNTERRYSSTGVQDKHLRNSWQLGAPSMVVCELGNVSLIRTHFGSQGMVRVVLPSLSKRERHANNG